ncbi:conserved hypothetical protein [Candidatus Magnetomoraceae bacterium gMMP-15]
MKLLHIFRSKPDVTVLKLVEVISKGNEINRFELYRDKVDYDHLVKLIFSSDKVINWW